MLEKNNSNSNKDSRNHLDEKRGSDPHLDEIRSAFTVNTQTQDP